MTLSDGIWVLCWDNGQPGGSTDPQWASGASPLGAAQVQGFCPQPWGSGDTFGCSITTPGSGASLGFKPQLLPNHRLRGVGQIISSLQVSVFPQKDVGLSEVIRVRAFL